ncbi:hypothetical protein V9K67_21460 [Paraflavisolibacter sp. H34]|uniref:hypothetical protein n=1 Tax=Huijunlia imazamoxiresistens TaxID=3127457 RepID=UPI0030197687
MKFTTNNSLKERPVFFGLKDIYVGYIGIAFTLGFILAFLASGIFGLSLGIGLAGTGLLVTGVYLFLRWVQKRPQDADVFLDRFLSYHMQGFKKISAGYSNNEQFLKFKKK